MSTRPSLKERKYIPNLLLTVTFFVLQSSDIFIAIVPVIGTVMQIKKVQSDDDFNIQKMNFNMKFLFLEHQKEFGSLLSSIGEGDLTNF